VENLLLVSGLKQVLSIVAPNYIDVKKIGQYTPLVISACVYAEMSGSCRAWSSFSPAAISQRHANRSPRHAYTYSWYPAYYCHSGLRRY